MPSQTHYCDKCRVEICYLNAISNGLCDNCTHKYFMTSLSLDEFLEEKDDLDNC